MGAFSRKWEKLKTHKIIWYFQFTDYYQNLIVAPSAIKLHNFIPLLFLVPTCQEQFQKFFEEEVINPNFIKLIKLEGYTPLQVKPKHQTCYVGIWPNPRDEILQIYKLKKNLLYQNLINKAHNALINMSISVSVIKILNSA